MGLIVSYPDDDESPRRSPRQPSPRIKIRRSKSDVSTLPDTVTVTDDLSTTTLSPPSRMSQSEGFLLLSSHSQESDERQVKEMKKLRHRSLSKTKPSNLPDFSKDGEKPPVLVLDSGGLDKKILLLGAGDGGKSTWLKQCRSLYQMFSTNELKSYREIVLSNLLDCTRILINAAEGFGYEIMDQQAVHQIKTLMDTVQIFVSVSTNVTPAIVQHIQDIYEEPAIKKTLQRRREFQYHENGDYWFENLDRITDPDYVPTMQDLIRTKVKTVGMIETEKVVEIGEELINADNVALSLVDVGGQRCERRKWAHGYRGASAVIYFIALSDFSEVCYEDETTNRLVEALRVFEGIMNYHGKAEALKNVKNVYLVFTKSDIFQKMIKEKNSTNISEILGEFGKDEVDTSVPIKFQEVEPNKDELVEKCRQYIARKFLNIVSDEKRRSSLSNRCFVVNCLQIKDVQFAMTTILKDICFGKKEL
jgi:GTPase SAR1 family protein